MAARTAAAERRARRACERALPGQRRDVRRIIFQLLLLLTLVFALGVLLVLLLDRRHRTAIPVLLDRGGEVFTSGYSSLPANARECGTGSIGSLVS